MVPIPDPCNPEVVVVLLTEKWELHTEIVQQIIS